MPKDGVDDENPARTYLFGPPTRLPKYLQEFAVDEAFKRDCVFDGPQISTCKGVGDHQHQFLTSDGVANCTVCNDTVCSHCKDEIDKKVYCLACFATESIVPQSGTADSKSIAAMRQELKDDYNFDGVDSLFHSTQLLKWIKTVQESSNYLHRWYVLNLAKKLSGSRTLPYTIHSLHSSSILHPNHAWTLATGYSCDVSAIRLIAGHLRWMTKLQCLFCMGMKLAYTNVVPKKSNELSVFTIFHCCSC